MRKILFLDIDGVLNHHKLNKISLSCGLDKNCVKWFNKTIEKFSPEMIISSAWRYLLLNKNMTLDGFKVLLRTHGVHKDINIIGCTTHDLPKDLVSHEAGIEGRRRQISYSIKELHLSESDKWVVLDDLDLGHAQDIHPSNGLFIKTNPNKGFKPYIFARIRKFYESNN